MNLALTAQDVLHILLRRIQRAGLLPGVDVERLCPNRLPADLSALLLSLPGTGWQHVCESERLVYIPAAVVVPCDLSLMFEQRFRGKDPSQGRDWYQFELIAPAQAITPRLYFLRGIWVYHDDNLPAATLAVQEGRCRDLTVLECVQVLLQTTADLFAPWGMSGLGSLTTRNPGLPYEGYVGSLRLHVTRDWAHVRAVLPEGDPNGRWLGSTFNHHVALCEGTVDPENAAKTTLGTLRRVGYIPQPA